MVQVGRPGLSYPQKSDLRRRRRKGQSLTEISGALKKHCSTIYDVVIANGGVDINWLSQAALT